MEITNIPEKWCIKVTEENRKEVGSWFNKNRQNKDKTNSDMSDSLYIGSYFHFPKYSDSFHVERWIKAGYIEITFDQFKKWFIELKVDDVISGIKNGSIAVHCKHKSNVKILSKTIMGKDADYHPNHEYGEEIIVWWENADGRSCLPNELNRCNGKKIVEFYDLKLPSTSFYVEAKGENYNESSNDLQPKLFIGAKLDSLKIVATLTTAKDFDDLKEFLTQHKPCFISHPKEEPKNIQTINMDGDIAISHIPIDMTVLYKSEQTVFILQKNYQLPVKIGGILDTLESGAEFKKDAYGYIHSSGIRFPATFVENNLEWFLPKENKTTLIKQRLHVTPEHETKNILYLIQMLKSFVDENTIIINCSPDYSSIGSQILSHQLSKSYPLKVYPLEMPYPKEEWNIEQSMQHIKDIIFNGNEKIIFFDSGCIRGKNYTLLNNYITSRIAIENMDRFYFTALFENIHSEFKCGFVSEFYNAKEKELHFWWETETNPAWFNKSQPLIDLSNTKIWIGNNPELNKKVQKKAIELGWGWYKGSKRIEFTEVNALFFSEKKEISYGSDLSFNRSNYKQILPADFGI